MGFAFINIIIMFAIFICIPVLIGVYVYRDATLRGMNAPLWTLIAVLAPTFIGFIIYLLARSQYGDLECPNCISAVREEYLSCPKCGIKLKASCPGCSFPVEADWSVCPRCSVALPVWEGNYMNPTVKKDKTLVKIIFIIVFLPILLLILIGIFGFANFRGGHSIINHGATIVEQYDAPLTVDLEEY